MMREVLTERWRRVRLLHPGNGDPFRGHDASVQYDISCLICAVLLAARRQSIKCVLYCIDTSIPRSLNA
jgi:hypothetical protein